MREPCQTSKPGESSRPGETNQPSFSSELREAIIQEKR